MYREISDEDKEQVALAGLLVQENQRYTLPDSKRLALDRILHIREMSPWIAAHNDSTIVIHVPGECLASENLNNLMDDIKLIYTVGIKVVIVSGCRPQVSGDNQDLGVQVLSSHLKNRGAQETTPFVDKALEGIVPRTDQESMRQIMEACGNATATIQAQLGSGAGHGGEADEAMRRMGHVQGITHVASGNFVRAHAVGVRDGVDHMLTGVVSGVNADRLGLHLAAGEIVLLNCLGYSYGGEVYNCSSEQVATTCAVQLKAKKLVFLHEGDVLLCGSTKKVLSSISRGDAQKYARALREWLSTARDEAQRTGTEPQLPCHRTFPSYLEYAVEATTNCAVRDVHLVPRHGDGSLLVELFANGGVGTLIYPDEL